MYCTYILTCSVNFTEIEIKLSRRVFIDVGWLANSCDHPRAPDHRTTIICFLVVPQSRHDECLLTVAHRKQSLCAGDRVPSWKPVIKGQRRSLVLKRNWLSLPSPSFTFVWSELLPAVTSLGSFHSLLILNRTMKWRWTGLRWLQEAACQTVKPCDGAAVGTIKVQRNVPALFLPVAGKPCLSAEWWSFPH